MEVEFSRIVEWAWEKLHYDAQAAKPRASELYNNLLSHHHYGQIDRLEELRALLPAKKGGVFDLYETKKFMIFRVVEESDLVLPFLTMRYDFGSGVGRVWILLGLICIDQRPDSAEGFGSIGYRVEPPEASGVGGVRSKHDYYHVQPIRAFRRGEAELRMCPPWLPDSCPTWPLHVANPIHAFLSVLVGLYGLSAIRELISDGAIDPGTRATIVEFVQRIAPESASQASTAPKRPQRKPR
jgi:hypothetical protein